MRFELEAVDATTRLAFVERVHPDYVAEFSDRLEFVPGTPWCPDTAAGYHGMLDGLGRFVCEDWTPDRLEAESERLVALANAGRLNGEHLYDLDGAAYARRTQAYARLIRARCPEG